MGDYGNMDSAFAGLLHDSAYNRNIRTRANGQERIDWGVGVFAYEGDDVNGYTVHQDIGVITLDADLVTDNVITTTLTIDGIVAAPVATTFNTDHDTTMDDHVSALETAFPGLVVTLTDGVNNREFTLFYKGKTIDEITSVVTLGASQAGITITYDNGQIFDGVSVFTQKGGKSTIGYYPQYAAVNVLERGFIWVETDGAVDSGQDAYIIWQAGADQGKFTATETDNYETGCKFRTSRSDAGLALVEVNGIHKDATP